MDEEALRLRALELACQAAQVWTLPNYNSLSGGNVPSYAAPEVVVSRAKAYLEFLSPSKDATIVAHAPAPKRGRSRKDAIVAPKKRPGRKPAAKTVTRRGARK